MGKKQKPKDRHLDVPAEANRDPSMDTSKGQLDEDPARDTGDKKNKFKGRNSRSAR